MKTAELSRLATELQNLAQGNDSESARIRQIACNLETIILQMGGVLEDVQNLRTWPMQGHGGKNWVDATQIFNLQKAAREGLAVIG